MDLPKLMVFLVFMMIHASTVFAELTVSPVAMFLNDSSRVSRINVGNFGSDSQFVEAGLLFGYPVSDQEGNVSFRNEEQPDPVEPSALGWTSVYPKRFMLPPGSSQVVVVMASPPADLPEGEYWVRPVLTIRAMGSPPTDLGDTSTAAFGRVEHKRVVLSMNYRRGSVKTGVHIESTMVREVSGSLQFILDLRRTGHAAYLGNLIIRVRNGDGEVVTEREQEIAVYHSLRRRVEFALCDWKAGEYSATIELNTNRPGRTHGDILQAPAVIKTINISFPGCQTQPAIAGAAVLSETTRGGGVMNANVPQKGFELARLDGAVEVNRTQRVSASAGATASTEEQLRMLEQLLEELRESHARLSGILLRSSRGEVKVK